MNARRAALATALFALPVSAVELVVGPWALTGLRTGDALPSAWPLRAAGLLLVLGGLAVLADALVRFAREGVGTPSPLAPPQRPVTGGVYRRLRHPMYTATTIALTGEALLLRQPILLAAAGLYALTFAVLVRHFEEPLLRRRFGEDWRGVVSRPTPVLHHQREEQPTMLARVTTWEGGTADGIRAAAEEMRSNIGKGPPPGIKSDGIMMLTDTDGGRVLMIGLFATEEDLLESEAVLKDMTPPAGMGNRTELAIYEVAAEARM
ncbi:MAG: hypothetical protein QOG68_18 [Solirubrobacteraceae bacterium]|nr:hypothetical protein [Solirubrobacteraceae bacterium]